MLNKWVGPHGGGDSFGHVAVCSKDMGVVSGFEAASYVGIGEGVSAHLRVADWGQEQWVGVSSRPSRRWPPPSKAEFFVFFQGAWLSLGQICSRDG